MSYNRSQATAAQDINMEMMEVEQQDPSNMSVEETWSSSLAIKSPVSPGAQSICSNNSEMRNGTKRRHKVQSFNRSNVHIEDYILKGPEDINAKVMRVLLPSMYQKFRHPDKETTKTKVKGLWEAGSKPIDFPADVDFKDPNNSKKMSNDMMKRFFVYLKIKLLENHPQYKHGSKYRHYEAEQSGASDVPQQQQVSYPAPVKKELPNLEPFHVLKEGHDARKSFVPQHEQPIEILYEVGSEEFKQPKEQLMTPGCPVIPETVEQISCIKEEEDTSAYPGFGVRANRNIKDAQLLVQYEVPDSTLCQQEQMMSPQPQSAIPVPCQTYTSRDNQGNMVTDLTILHKMNMAEMPQTITMVEDDGFRQPVNPQEVALSEADPDSTQNSQCAQFVEGMRSELMPVLQQFETTFADYQVVIKFTSTLLEEVFKPMLNIASQGNREKAVEMSHFCTSFMGILKRSMFLGVDGNPLRELEELKQQYCSVYSGSVIPESCVPPVDNEVQVFNVQATTLPSFMSNGHDHYLPTIASINARAERKQQEIEGVGKVDIEPMDEIWQDKKVIVEKDPFPEGLLSPMTRDMGNVILDAEQDLGISLKRSESCEDTEDPRLELNHYIEKLMRKQAKESSVQGQQADTASTVWLGMSMMTEDHEMSSHHTQQQVAPAGVDMMNQVNPSISCQPDMGNEDQAIAVTLQDAYQHFGCDSMDTDCNWTKIANGDLSNMVHVYGLDGSTADMQVNNVACSDQLVSEDTVIPKITVPVPAVQKAVSLPPKVLDPWNGVLGKTLNIPTTVFETAACADDEGPKAKRRAKGKGVMSCGKGGKGYKRLPTHGKGKRM